MDIQKSPTLYSVADLQRVTLRQLDADSQNASGRPPAPASATQQADTISPEEAATPNYDRGEAILMNNPWHSSQDGSRTLATRAALPELNSGMTPLDIITRYSDFILAAF